MMRTRLLTVLLLLSIGQPAFAAAELRPFLSDSLAQITAAREGRPFLLLLWSLDCPPCLKELAGLKALAREMDGRELVLVSTDGPSNSAAAARVLHDLGLGGLDNWIFADDYSERLRYHVDPDWFGELPRAYFYSADHNRRAHSGVLTPEQLQHWLQQTRAQGF